MSAVTIEVEAEELLTIKQVSSVTDIPISSIRKYCGKYRKYMGLSRGDNNTLLFSKQSIQTLVKVRALTGQGLKPKTILNQLAEGQPSMSRGWSNPDKDGEANGSTALMPIDRLTSPEVIQELVYPVIQREVSRRTSDLERKAADLEKQNLGLLKVIDDMRGRMTMLESHQKAMQEEIDRPDPTIWDKIKAMLKRR